MYIAFHLRMTYIVCTTEQGFDLWSCKSLCLLYFILPVNLGKRKKLVLSLWSQPLLYLLISLFINLSSWKKMAITLIPCFVSHSWTRDLVENIDFLMLQHCSLLFWIGGTILVLGAEFRIDKWCQRWQEFNGGKCKYYTSMHILRFLFSILASHTHAILVEKNWKISESFVRMNGTVVFISVKLCYYV